MKAYLDKGQVKLRLDFPVDYRKVSEGLEKMGYHTTAGTENPEMVDSIGWGKGYDREGYYPYWVYDESPGRPVLAISPEDYDRDPSGDNHPYIGPNSRAELKKWYRILQKIH